MEDIINELRIDGFKFLAKTNKANIMVIPAKKYLIEFFIITNVDK